MRSSTLNPIPSHPGPTQPVPSPRCSVCLEPDQAAFIWACGLFEGEGSIVHYRDQRQAHRSLQLSSTDEDVIRRFWCAIGMAGVVYGPYEYRGKYAGRKRKWDWKAAAWAETAPLLERMLPFLGERRLAAAREFLADPPKTWRGCG